MADATFAVVHEEPLGPKPPSWRDYWLLALTNDASSTYEALADEHLAGTEVSLGRIVRYLGMSKARFNKALSELEGHGFLWLDAEECPPVVSVRSVPEPDPDAPPPAPRRRPKTAWHSVWEFSNHWCDLHDRHVGAPYPRPARGGRDTYLIDEMLRSYPISTLRDIASWFFKSRTDQEPATIAYFCFHLPRLVSGWKAQGGVALPRMKEEESDTSL